LRQQYAPLWHKHLGSVILTGSSGSRDGIGFRVDLRVGMAPMRIDHLKQIRCVLAKIRFLECCVSHRGLS